MAKPINPKAKLPGFNTTEVKRVFNKLGFKHSEGNQKHIKYVDSKGREVILIKGNKDINPYLLKQIIKEVSEKLGITKEELIEKFIKYK